MKDLVFMAPITATRRDASVVHVTLALDATLNVQETGSALTTNVNAE